MSLTSIPPCVELGDEVILSFKSAHLIGYSPFKDRHLTLSLIFLDAKV